MFHIAYVINPYIQKATDLEAHIHNAIVFKPLAGYLHSQIFYILLGRIVKMPVQCNRFGSGKARFLEYLAVVIFNR